MFPEFSDVLETLADPQTRHAALVHFPVVLSVVGIFIVLATALAGGKSKALRWTALVTYGLLVGMSFLAVKSGEAAHSELGAMPDLVHEVVENHEELAERVWIFAAVVAGLLLLSFVSKPVVRVGAGWLAALVAVGVAGWMGATAHHGGRLVYEFGVGTPNPALGPDSTGGSEHEDDDHGGAAAATDDPRVAFFVSQVKPILADNCQRCHNPRRKHRAGDLDQTSREGLLAGGSFGPAIVPGEPDRSLLILAVTWENEDLQMPPDEEQLPEASIEVLRQWIRDGAVWEDGAGL